MPISRKDLADAGLPETLVKRILQAEPNLPVPVPLEELCARLGIVRIDDLHTDKFKCGNYFNAAGHDPETEELVSMALNELHKPQGRNRRQLPR